MGGLHNTQGGRRDKSYVPSLSGTIWQLDVGTLYAWGGGEDKWRAVSQLVLCVSTLLHSFLFYPLAGVPFLVGTAKPSPVSRVMFASTMLWNGLYVHSTGLGPLSSLSTPCTPV
jgi:hypothetical protein